MSIWVALLRGINVSGQKIIKMEDLKKAFESLHFEPVVTYIQSGNVVFGSTASDASHLRSQIQAKLSKTFGFEIPVIVRSLTEIGGVGRRIPFKKIRANSGERLYVSFLSEKPASGAAENLAAVKDQADEVRLSGSEVFILCRNGFGNTLFSNTFIEKKLAVSATTRNWDTVQKLLSLGQGLAKG